MPLVSQVPTCRCGAKKLTPAGRYPHERVLNPYPLGAEKGPTRRYIKTWESLDSLGFPRIPLADHQSIPRNELDRRRLFLETMWMPVKPLVRSCGSCLVWRHPAKDQEFDGTAGGDTGRAVTGTSGPGPVPPMRPSPTTACASPEGLGGSQERLAAGTWNTRRPVSAYRRRVAPAAAHRTCGGSVRGRLR